MIELGDFLLIYMWAIFFFYGSYKNIPENRGAIALKVGAKFSIYEAIDKIPEICIQMSTNLYRIIYILDKMDQNVYHIGQNFLQIMLII